MKTHAAIMFVLIGILVFATNAKANEIPGYPKATRAAEKSVLLAAKERYDIIPIIATCKRRSDRTWKCVWSGMTRVDGEPVWGRMVSTKQGWKVATTMHWGYAHA
jgi:hypothetical protein